MPCKTCKTQLLYINGVQACPKCKNLSIVPFQDSLEIASHYIELFKQEFETIIKKYNKNDLLIKIFWQREKEIIDFNRTYSTLDLSSLTATSLLLRSIPRMGTFHEESIANKNDIDKVIEIYSKLLDFEEDKSKLEAKTWNMINFVKYDLDKLEKLPLMNSVQVCPNEQYSRVIQTLDKHNIMSKKIAKERIKIWSKDYVPVEKGSKKIYTVKETIKTFYELISTFYTAFLRSSVYSKAFQIPNENLSLNPIDIKKFLGRYIFSYDKVTKIDYSLFREDVIMIFKRDYREILSNFVLSEDNLDAMPLFLRIDDEIFVSQSFGEMYCYFLHTIVNKEEFDDETKRRSKIYEQNIVKQYFTAKGFEYYNSFQVKNKMEIDGIAISDTKVYVIEVKGWGSSKLLEEKTAVDILNREIKNAIDGIHIHQYTKKIKYKKSIKQKVEWISSNRSLFKIKETTPIIGMLIINESPSITEYHNCKVNFVNDFIYSKNGSQIMT